VRFKSENFEPAVVCNGNKSKKKNQFSNVLQLKKPGCFENTVVTRNTRLTFIFVITLLPDRISRSSLNSDIIEIARSLLLLLLLFPLLLLLLLLLLSWRFIVLQIILYTSSRVANIRIYYTKQCSIYYRCSFSLYISVRRRVLRS
jgi:hypothetical protein